MSFECLTMQAFGPGSSMQRKGGGERGRTGAGAVKREEVGNGVSDTRVEARKRA